MILQLLAQIRFDTTISLGTVLHLIGVAALFVVVLQRLGKMESHFDSRIAGLEFKMQDMVEKTADIATWKARTEQMWAKFVADQYVAGK